MTYSEKQRNEYRVFMNCENELGRLFLGQVQHQEDSKGDPFVLALVSYMERQKLTGHYKISIRGSNSRMPVTHVVESGYGETREFFVSHSLNKDSPFGDFTWEVIP